MLPAAAFLVLLVLLLLVPPAAARDVRVAFHEIPPSIYTDANGQPAGIFVDMTRDIAAQEGWNVTWVNGTLKENWERLGSGQIDLMAGVVDTPEREKIYDFNTEPALSAWTQVYAPRGSGIRTILDLDGKRVAMVRGDINGILFSEYARKFNIQIITVETDSLDQAFSSPATGTADAVVGFNMGGEGIATKYGLSMTSVMMNPTTLHFAVANGKNADLLAAADRYLSEGKTNPSSAYRKTIQKWFGVSASGIVLPPYFWPGLAAIAGLAALFIAMSVYLRREVQKKTAELVHRNEQLQAAYEQLAAAEEELRANYEDLRRSDKALMQARRKLSLLNTLTFQDLQTGIFSLGGYVQLAKSAGCSDAAKERLGKIEGILRSLRGSLDFARKYQDLGISQPRWQAVEYALINAISHLDFSGISRTVNLDGLEIYADPLLEDVFLTLMENVLAHGAGTTEVRIGYRRNGDSITILVEDNGPGIPAGEKENIFGREYVGKAGTALFLAREILSVTDIGLKETGVPGSGARFEIVVPDAKYRFPEKKDPS